MKIIKQSAKLLWHTENPEQIIESAGRTAYRSEDKITSASAAKFVAFITSNHHTSVVEHASASFEIVTDRAIANEITRHRIASFTQESTRYCNYGKDKFGGEIEVIEPPLTTQQDKEEWVHSMLVAEQCYLNMVNNGCTAQLARSVLPLCLRTKLVMTCNLRSWLHFFNLRCAKSAHPQIIELARMMLLALYPKAPNVFAPPYKKFILGNE
jgi:thymidylate synthase (FAD)